MSLPLISPIAPSIAEIGAARRATAGTVSTEVVVIGTGAGGAVAGTTLAKKHKVLFLEAGGAFTKRDYQKKDFLWSTEHLYARKGAQLSSGGNARLTVPQGMTVGGSTVLNSAICFKPPDERLREWQALTGAAHLSPEAMAPIVDDIWQRIGVFPTHLGIGRRNNDVLRLGMERLGVPRHAWMDRNAPGCVGCGACHLGCPSGGKASVDRSILPEAIGRGAEVLIRARAERIDHNGGRASSVWCHVLDDDGNVTGSLEVKADLIIVAGSAMRSPVLLQKSGLGNDELGRHLAIHPGVAVFGDFDDPINMWNGVPQGYWADVPEHKDALIEVANVGPDLLFSMYARAGQGGLDVVKRFKHLAMAGVMIRDQQTGRVSVARDGDMAFSYDLVDHHLEAWRAGCRLMVRAYFAAGARSVAVAAGDMQFHATEAVALAAVEAMKGPADVAFPYGSHPQGTCRMGPAQGPHRGVVDGNGRVHGTDNVYVMDGSIFPTTLGVNPQVTIMSLASALSSRLIA